MVIRLPRLRRVSLMTSPKSSAFPVEIKSHRDLNQASYLLGIHFPGSACLPGLITKPLLERIPTAAGKTKVTWAAYERYS